MQIYAENKKAHYDYEIIEKYEAGQPKTEVRPLFFQLFNQTLNGIPDCLTIALNVFGFNTSDVCRGTCTILGCFP